MSSQSSDLQILIRQANAMGRTELRFEIRASNPRLGLNFLEFGPVILNSSPEVYARGWGDDIREIFGESVRREVTAEYRDIQLGFEQSGKRRVVGEHRLAGKGATMYKDLLPEGLQVLLWSLQGKVSTLQILSDEPHIPWEAMKLRTREAGLWRDGPFLCEAFAVSRWLRGTPEVLELPVANVALVVPKLSQLPNAAKEREALLALLGLGREITEIAPRFSEVVESLAVGSFDAWHFSGHGRDRGADPNRWDISLDDGSALRPEDLNAAMSNLGNTRPLVFFNACHTGRAGVSLAGVGGWSKQLLDLGVGAFIGTHWTIDDKSAKEFAIAFYRRFLGGMPIAESVRQARNILRDSSPGDPTWLAYTLFAHPLAVCTRRTEAGSRLADVSPLILPSYSWQSSVSSPAALLRADYGVVPFHGRGREFDELVLWCLGQAKVAVRLYTGPAGSGKTRLALELVRELQSRGWRAGSLAFGVHESWASTWMALANHGKHVLIVVDGAETRRLELAQIARACESVESGPIRLLLLAQSEFEWWEQLQAEDGVGGFFTGSATSKARLEPLAVSIGAREDSYREAQTAFAARMNLSLPERQPPELSAALLDQALMLHMKALLELRDVGEGVTEVDLFHQMLVQEQRFWQIRCGKFGLAGDSLPAIARAMGAISLVGGVKNERDAIALLRRLRPFASCAESLLEKVSKVLHSCYDGEAWINPLLPEALGAYLAEREVFNGADELLDLLWE